MTIPEVQHARDYNRGLGAPVRAVHIAWGVGLWLTRPVRAWAGQPARRSWAVPLCWGIIIAAVMGMVDGRVARWCAGFSVPSVVPVLLYGSLLMGAIVASAMDSEAARSRRIADLAAAFIGAFVLCGLAPLVVGRPVPKFADPGYFIGPFGEYPIGAGLGIRHSWEFWAPRVSELWSMPSREAAYAVVGVVHLGAAWRRGRGVAIVAGGLACAAVIASRTHYASDVAVGAVIGAAVARTALARRWGGRVVSGERG